MGARRFRHAFFLLSFLCLLALWWGGLNPSGNKRAPSGGSDANVHKEANSSFEGSEEVGGAVRREVIDPMSSISIVLWDKKKGVELKWASPKGKATILGGSDFSLVERGGRLTLAFPKLNTGEIELEIRYDGFFKRRVSLDPGDFEGAADSVSIGLTPIQQVRFRISGAEEVFQSICRISLVEGFFADSADDISFPLSDSREFQVALAENVSEPELTVQLDSDVYGAFRWTLSNAPTSIATVVLELPDIVDFDVEYRDSNKSGSVLLRIRNILPNGLHIASGEGTLFLERPKRFTVFAGSYELVGTNPLGNKVQKNISLSSLKTDEVPSFVLDFQVDQVATFEQSPAPPARIVLPRGIVQFSLRFPEGVEPSFRYDIRLWQFSPNRQRKDLCTLSNLPETVQGFETLECSFKGWAQRLRGLAQFGLEIIVPGVRQGGLAIIEVPYDSEVLDFGVIELAVPGELLLFVSGLHDLHQYSVALAPASLISVNAEDLPGYFGVFVPEMGCYRFSDIVAGDYEIGAFHRGEQLASFSQLYVPPPQPTAESSLSCDLLPPGVVTIVASQKAEPLIEYSISQIHPGFWPFKHVQQVSTEIAETEFYCPAEEDLLVKVYARLVAGERLSPVLFVPFVVEPRSHSEINLIEPPGGVVAGTVEVENTAFPFLMAVPSNLRPFGFVGAEGKFRLTGCGSDPLELFLLDHDFKRWPLSSFKFELEQGHLLPSGEIIPEN